MKTTESLYRFLNSINMQTASQKFAVDSRNVIPGAIFLALEGKKSKGTDFIEDAYKKGAVAAIVPKNFIPNKNLKLPLYFVEDTLETLQELASERIKFYSPKIVAVTGSVGKTTSKSFLQTFLEYKYKVMATPGNQNSQIGLPLAILNEMKGDEEILILEMGMSEKGNIRRLVEIAPPEIAMVTHVDFAHMENFLSLKEVSIEKSSIFSHPNTKLGFFSESIFHKEVFYQTGVCQKFLFSGQSREAMDLFKNLNPPFQESHILNNLYGVIQIVLSLGFSIREIADIVPKLNLPEKRFNKMQINDVLFINDSYNACPISVKAGLNSLPEAKGGKKIAIIGEMLELGNFSDFLHKDVGEHALDKIDLMICLGKETLPIVKVWKNHNREVYYYEKLSDLIKVVKLFVKAGDVVFVKGSKAKEMWKIVEEF